MQKRFYLLAILISTTISAVPSTTHADSSCPTPVEGCSCVKVRNHGAYSVSAEFLECHLGNKNTRVIHAGSEDFFNVKNNSNVYMGVSGISSTVLPSYTINFKTEIDCGGALGSTARCDANPL